MLADNALGFTLMEIPDFLAGLMYGFTEDNHLTEIELCYTGGVNVDQYIKTALEDLHVGGTDWDLQAVLNFGLAALNVPVMLKTCEGMGDDLKAVENWAAIFKHPEQLTTQVTKNYLLHRKAIDSDISSFKSDWAAKEYFKAGVDAANLLTVAIGPVKVTPTLSALPSSNELMMVPDFVAGLFYGFTDENHLTEIEACYEGAKLDVSLFDSALKELEAGEIIKAAKSLSKAMSDLSSDITACKMTAMADDVKAVEQWAAIFEHPTQLVTTVGTHYALHKRGISKDITAEKTDFATGEYFQAGVVTADVLELLLGPVYPKNSNEMLGFTAMEIPDFVAGLLYGWTGDNHLTEVEACYNSDLPILEDMQHAADELFHGHVLKSIASFEKAVYNLQVAMEPCHAMQDDIAAIEAWAAMFKEPAHLVEVVGLNWELHKRGIRRDIDTTKTDFAAGEYFKAGESTADAFTLLFGKVE